VGDRIFETIEQIRKNPLAFKECEALPTPEKIYRQAICMSWLIIFRIKKSEIVILGIIHGSRNPSRLKKIRRIK
jgi:plasmid stabilization system protein ParE